MSSSSLKIFSILFISTLGLSACATHDFPQMEPAKTAVTEYVLSGEWNKDISSTIDKYKSDIENIIASAKPGSQFVAFFDIDETSLSNFKYWFRLQSGFNQDLWDTWTKEGDAEVIPATLEFYKWLKEKGVKVYFYTGRYQFGNTLQEDATVKNLKREGYLNPAGVIFRPQTKASKSDHGAKKHVDFKSAFRCGLSEKGSTLLLTLGDQWSDHAGDCPAMFQIKLPDSMYTLPKPMMEIQKKYNYDAGKLKFPKN